jgi:hypothetical protein
MISLKYTHTHTQFACLAGLLCLINFIDSYHVVDWSLHLLSFIFTPLEEFLKYNKGMKNVRDQGVVISENNIDTFEIDCCLGFETSC